MSEETEAVPEAREQEHEHHPVKQNSGSSGVFIAILLALGALGASYYLWQQQQIANKNAQTMQGEMNKLLGVIEQRHQDLVERLKTVPEHQHPQINQRLDKMQAMLFELRSHLGQERRGWQVAEVEYLLRIAEHRLRFERDINTAIAALQTAGQRLQALNDPAFVPVIQSINRDIQKLSTANLPDRDALAAQVASIGTAIDNLPLAVTAVQSTTLKDKPDTTTTQQTSVWQRMWHDILGLVTIRRAGEADRPMLVPEQRYFLKQNLQLKLESARLALLAGNDASWRASLDEASQWIRRYFDTSAPAAQMAIETLAQLAATELKPALPTLSDTRQLLQRAAMQQSAPRPAIPTPAPAPQPAQTQPKPAAAPEQPATESPAEPAPQETAPVQPPAETKEKPAVTDTTPEPAPGSEPATQETPADTPAPPADDVPQLQQGTGQ